MEKKILICFLLFSPFFVSAGGATLYLSPSSGTYDVSKTFAVNVLVNSGGVSINAAEGFLTFDPSEVSVVNISKQGSIFNLWTQEPSFSEGGIKFGGGVASGFSGSSGKIFQIVFRAKKAGIASVGFFEGSVLAADGKGTNILSSKTGGAYTFKEIIIASPPPRVYSDSHPASADWYSDSNPSFSWEMPSSATAVKLLLNSSPSAVPTYLFGPITEKQFSDIPDGVLYLHVSYKDQKGWSQVGHKKIMIDTKPPDSFEIEVQKNEKVVLLFKAEDDLSGIDYFKGEITAPQEEPVEFETKDSSFEIESLLPGKYMVKAWAFDKAGNSASTSLDVVVEKVYAPEITFWPEEIYPGQFLALKGSSVYPETIVSVYVQKGTETERKFDIETDEQGNWVFIDDAALEKGVYRIWADLEIDEIKSDQSEVINIEVEEMTTLGMDSITLFLATLFLALITIVISMIILIVLRKKRKESASSWQSPPA